jgi:hypothetical protein
MVTGFLVYCFIGSLIWLVLDGLGVIQHTFVTRIRNGKPTSNQAMVLATVMMILFWPLFIARWVRGMLA